MMACAWCLIGNRAPLPTVMDEDDGRREEDGKLPGDDDMWEDASVSKYHSDAFGGWCGMPAFGRAT